MREKIVQIRRDQNPLGHFIRIGSTGHIQLEEALAGDRVQIERAVFDASVVKSQAHLRDALRGAGAELILDTNVAELASVGRYDGVVRNCAWAAGDRPLQGSDFDGSAGKERMLKIAQCALEHNFRTVLAPTHLLSGAEDPNFALDLRICRELRSALDASGGAAVSIDYPLLISATTLREPRGRAALIAALKSLPFDNLWLRIAGFGASATPIAVRRYIEALQDFQGLERPLVGDNVAGLNGLAALAFGALGGIVHGIGIGETFNNGTWKRRPTKRDQKGGAGTRILLPFLDRHLKPAQLKDVMDANGGRRLAACHDATCCRRGYDDMIADPRGHYLRTRRSQMLALSQVSEFMRPNHFLREDLTKAERTSAMMGRLKLSDPKVKEIIGEETDRLHRLHVMLEVLQEQGIDQRRALVPAPRASRTIRSSRISR
ncbi:MAG: hypothetical protein JWM87_3955 [Candidatus Eremiobacteraeota bacterium]|nr:hypothetical protein [Candidatus Eremiobacteraeota bacterium]